MARGFLCLRVSVANLLYTRIIDGTNPVLSLQDPLSQAGSNNLHSKLRAAVAGV